MTPLETRFAEDEATAAEALAKEVHDAYERYRSRTAAQEANVQVGSAGGQWVQCGHCHGVGCKECNGSGAFTVAAPHPAPAPASGEVTDAMVRAAEDALDRGLYIRDALEAATRARQDAPNAADAEAYLTPRLADAEKLSEAIGLHNLVDHTGGNIISDWLVLEGLERIGAVIPTAAPVPADEGEKT